jgi:tubulin--tyrosine ligase
MIKFRKQKDVFEVIPLTFLITKGINDPEFQRFCTLFEDLAAKSKNQKMSNNVWICKPGENSNRGNGIQVVSSIS